MHTTARSAAKYAPHLLPAVVLAGLSLVGAYDFLLFHTLVEVLTILVGWGVFIVAWNSQQRLEGNFYLIIGIASVFIGFLDLMHALSYKGMGVFPGEGANPAAQYWIAARYLQAITFLVAPAFVRGLRRPLATAWVYAALTAAATAAITTGVFPACYVEGAGATAFKTASEYVISLVFAAAMAQLYRHRRGFESGTVRLLLVFLALSIAAELNFATNLAVYGFADVLGHLLRLVASYLLYLALVSVGLTRPQELLFRNLRKSEQALRESEERLRSIVHNSDAAVFVRDAGGKAVYVSPQCERVLGHPLQTYSENSLPDFIHPEDRPRFDAAVRRVYDSGEGFRDLEHRTMSSDGSYRWVSTSAGPITFADGTRGVQTHVRDISDKKRTELLQRTRLQLWETARDGSTERVLQAALAAAEEATGSRIAFLHFVDADQQHVSLQAWSPNTVSGPCSARGTGLHYPISEAGVWVECMRTREPVIHNDYAGLANRKGLPEGHAPLTRELVVPIIRADKVAAIVGVGNKASDYVAEDAEAVAMIGEMVQEIVERQRADAARAQLAAVVEASSDAIISRGTDLKVISWNAAAERMFGYAAREVIGRDIGFIVPESCRAEVERNRALLAAGVSVPAHDTLRITRDGRLIDVSVAESTLRDAAGNMTGVSLVIRDITERKRAEQAAREIEARFRTVFDNSPIGISIAHMSDGRIVDINEAAERQFGYRREQVIGRTAAELGLYTNPERRAQLVERLRSEGRVEQFLTQIRHADGAIREVELAARAIVLDGKPCLVAMMVDVTERRRLEELHARAQKLESLGTLAGGIAHDFNNILAAIRGNADLAAHELGPQHSVAESLREINKAAARAAELVRRIMAFGRPGEAGRTVVDLAAVAEEVLKLLRSTLPAGIALEKDFAEDVPQVLADAGQVHEAIVNLTTNAAHAIGARAGRISYALAPVDVDAQQAQSVPGLEPGRYARLTVSDDGCGMDAQTMERIFDAFYTTKPVGEGTGLGLSMVHGIMKSHAGVVTVESAPGAGSSFALYFPAARQGLAEPLRSGTEPMEPGAGCRVMYVDDEEALVFLAKRVLTRLGHSVTGFTDPLQALQDFRADPQNYDVVVTDLSMPHMSGFELAEALLAARPGIPVLMTSGYLRERDEQRVRATGIRELILKPNTMEELGRVLDRLMRHSQATNR